MKVKLVIDKTRTWLLQDRRRVVMLMFISLFAVVGTIALIVSQAAGPSIAIEAENGTITTPATKITDSTASNGSAIQFNASGGNGGGGGPTATWGDHMGISLWPNRQNFDKAKALGVSWVRISWEQNWGAFDDSLIAYAHGLGLKVLQNCQKTPHSYSASDVFPFAAYCAAWVDKGVDAIEIGNEWNHSPFWQPAPDSTYALPAAFFDATSVTIRAKSTTIPIMNSGWSPEASPNLPQEAMAKSLDRSYGAFKTNANVIAHHGYAYNCDSPLKCNYPARKDWNAFLATQDVYSAAKSRGFDHTIWLTEIGGPSGNGNNLYTNQPFTLASQAQLYNDYIAGIAWLKGGGTPIDAVFWHTIQDGQSSTNSVEQTFGLYDANWNIKPAGQVVKDQAGKVW